jgi:hypothetical protein
LHQGHHFGWVTFSDDLNLRDAPRDIFLVALRQVYPECVHVLLQITNSLCPRDGHNVFALGEHPGQCQLCRRSALFASQLLDRCSQLEVFLQGLLSETGIRLSESFAGSVYRSLRTFKDFSAAASAICSS